MWKMELRTLRGGPVFLTCCGYGIYFWLGSVSRSSKLCIEPTATRREAWWRRTVIHGMARRGRLAFGWGGCPGSGCEARPWDVGGFPSESDSRGRRGGQQPSKKKPGSSRTNGRLERQLASRHLRPRIQGDQVGSKLGMLRTGGRCCRARWMAKMRREVVPSGMDVMRGRAALAGGGADTQGSLLRPPRWPGEN